MSFFGSFKHQVDANGRFRIPSEFKETLGSRYMVTLGANKCLCIFDIEDAQAIFKAKFGNADPTGGSMLKATRIWYGNTSIVTDDSQGRTLIPSELRKKASLNKNVVTIGVDKWIEVWDEDKWNEYNEQDFDEVMEDFNHNAKATLDAKYDA